MTKYRKKPVVIEAWPINELRQAAAVSWRDLPEPIVEAYEMGNVLFGDSEVLIKTLEGWMTGNKGDWIIRGVTGELYSCRDDIFRLTYEPVDDEPQPAIAKTEGGE